MKNLKKTIGLLGLLFLVTFPAPGQATGISEYTSFPPFLPRVVSPNILFLLDFSNEMVRPAYGECNELLSDCRETFLQFDDFVPADDYYGYFDSNSKYSYSDSGQQFQKDANGTWDGDWLNWLTMTQFDVLKKVSVGGDINPAPEQSNPSNFDLTSKLVTGSKFYRVVDASICSGKAPAAFCDASVMQEIPYWEIDTSGETPLVSGTHDAESVPYELPFPFEYYGTEFSHLSIGIDGYVLLSESAVSSTLYYNSKAEMPNGSAPNNILAPLWDDASMISARNSAIKVFTRGTSPNRVLVVSFENMISDLDTSSNKSPLSYQVLFFESSNQIVFQYVEVQEGNTVFGGGRTATIGVENGDGTEWKGYSYNGSSLLTNGMALLATPNHFVVEVEPQTNNETTFKPLDGTTYEVSISVQNQPGCPEGSYSYRDDKPNHTSCYDHELRGLVQDLRDSEKLGNLGFRLGIMQPNSVDNNGATDGGKVIKHFNDKDSTGWASLMNSTRSQAPTGDAPLAEALHMAQGYFRQDTDFNLGISQSSSSWSNDGVDGSCGSNSRDPLCFASAGEKVECVKSYVLMVSSGNFSHDFGLNIDGTTITGDKSPHDDAWEETGGSNYLEKIAYKGHTTDLRSTLDGDQFLHLYAVNTYGGEGEGTEVLKRAAHYGGSKPGDDPDNPRTYFKPEAGANLRDKIISAVNEILKNSASGTSVSVLSTSAGGEGALYQAYFYPAKVENQTEDRRWPGFLRAFFLDRRQQLRDDSGGADAPDGRLVPDEDRRVEMFLHPNTYEVMVRRLDNEGSLINEIRMDDIVSIWEGGRSLATMEKNDRDLYTWLDDGNGTVESSEILTLPTDPTVTDTAVTDLIPFLRAEDTEAPVNGVTAIRRTAAEEAVRILNFTRGKHVGGFRNRCISIAGATMEAGCTQSGQRVWPLGDIIFSTPTLVGAPGERYDAIYSDASYRAYAQASHNRRQMVYVGANDGMLHAFNAGFYYSGDDLGTSAKAETGWFQDNEDPNDHDPEIGQEKWAFIPYDNLPHLAWLSCNGTRFNPDDPNNKDYDPAICGSDEYTHVYYVDQRPKVTDVRIFNDPDNGVSGLEGQTGASHPHGWGTILIMPMRLGGGAINVTDDFGDGSETRTFRSAYYIFDITDPELPPKLLHRFTSSDLGFTTSYPAIVRIEDGGTGKWFMVVGSGPMNQPGEDKDLNRDYNHLGTSDLGQPGKVYVVGLEPTWPVTSFTPVADNGIMGDPTVVDVDLDFTSDVIYIGSAIDGTSGRVYRINTNQDQDPANWNLSTLFDPSPSLSDPDPDAMSFTAPKDMGPLLVGPSASKDIFGNLWVFFGSGRLKSTGDLDNSDQQRFYGIKDRCWKSTSQSACSGVNGDVLASEDYAYIWDQLYNARAVKVNSEIGSATQVEAGGTDICGANETECSYQTLLTNARTYKGWYFNLDNPATASERVLARSSVLGGLVLFTTFTPASDRCSIFGQSNMYALYYETGTAYLKPVFEGAEGVFSEGGTEYVQNKFDLGSGMPTSVGVAVGETVTGFVQKSTGEIMRIETKPGLGVRSGTASWREKNDAGGDAAIEMIYKHIVK